MAKMVVSKLILLINPLKKPVYPLIEMKICMGSLCLFLNKTSDKCMNTYPKSTKNTMISWKSLDPTLLKD